MGESDAGATHRGLSDCFHPISPILVFYVPLHSFYCDGGGRGETRASQGDSESEPVLEDNRRGQLDFAESHVWSRESQCNVRSSYPHITLSI